MGRAARQMPKLLAQKLQKIRGSLGFTQDEIAARLNDLGAGGIDRSHVSKYERGILEPGIKTLLGYSRLVNIELEVLADDDLSLPDRLPA